MTATTSALPESVAQQFSADLRERLTTLRRDIHREPELSFQEHRTAKRLEQALSDLSISNVERVGGTGVVARVRGRSPDAPVVAIRGDIDALPIEEATGLPFASANGGVMHAC